MSTENSRYIEAIGRRKTSIARVRVWEASKSSITINDREFDNYFPTSTLRTTVKQPIEAAKLSQKFKITAMIKGGGISSQADALRHGIARALVAFDAELRKPLKAEGYLTRDARSVERKKPGLKKARKSPQWSKR